LMGEDLFRLDANDCFSGTREVGVRGEVFRAYFGHTQALHLKCRWSVVSSSVGVSNRKETAASSWSAIT